MVKRVRARRVLAALLATGSMAAIALLPTRADAVIEPPAIEILKEVSVDGGATFFDANDSSSAPVTAVGGDALYRITVTNTGSSDLVDVVINDAALGIEDYPVGNLATGTTVVLTSGQIPELNQPGRCLDPGDVTNISTAGGLSSDTGNTVSDSDPAVVKCVQLGGEGCTPGFWRNHLADWAPTDFSPGDDFDTTFDVNLFTRDITLEQAVKLGGGGVRRLARHGTAALLSAAHPSVDYPYTVAEVIALVQAGDADALEAANELGCDLNGTAATPASRRP